MEHSPLQVLKRGTDTSAAYINFCISLLAFSAYSSLLYWVPLSVLTLSVDFLYVLSRQFLWRLCVHYVVCFSFPSSKLVISYPSLLDLTNSPAKFKCQASSRRRGFSKSTGFVFYFFCLSKPA